MRLVVNAARWRIQFKDRSSKEVGAYALRLINLRWVVGLLVKTGAFRSMIKGKGLIAPDEA